MRQLLLLSLLAAPAAFAQQVEVHVAVPVPTITFTAPPPLVVVQPGVQVVEDYDEEVFFVDGWYWTRRDARWYRAKDHHGGWVVVENRGVPGTIVRFPPGQYRKWKKGKKATVIVNPPGPGKVKVKVKKEKHHGGKHH